MRTWTSEEIDALWDYSDPAASAIRFEAAIDDGAGDEARTQLARALGLQGCFDDAREALHQVRLEGASPLVRARHALEMGRVLNSSGSPEAARPWFEAALDLATNAGEESYAIDAAHMIAIVAPEAERLAWHERTLAMVDAARDPRAKKWEASVLNNAAWTLHDAGRFEEALRLFERAVRLREGAGQPGPLRIAHYAVGRCLRSLGRVAEALAVQEALFASDPDDGFFQEELALCLVAQGRNGDAAPFARRAHELLSEDEWFVQNEPGRLETLWDIASGP